MSHNHAQPHDHHHSFGDAVSTVQHRVLDLDADVFGANLADVLDRAELTSAKKIVDLGAGSGAGSRLLRSRFPDAEITCVDNDPQMLEVLRGQGFAAVSADLDDGFPPAIAGPVDVVWASSSLHHVADVKGLLAGVRQALVPGGILIVVELATLPSFLADAQGTQLEERCHAASAAEGWNHHPDWAPIIEAAGFTVTKTEVTTSAADTPEAREYGREWFERFAKLQALTADDRAAVTELLGRFADDLVIEPRTTRTVWVATAGFDRQ